VCGIFTYSQLAWWRPPTRATINRQRPTRAVRTPRAREPAIVLDGTGSFDPEGRPLTYRWEPAEFFEDPSLAQPTFRAGDNMIVFVELYVYDQVEALWDSTTAMVVVGNVPPTVTIDPGSDDRDRRGRGGDRHRGVHRPGVARHAHRLHRLGRPRRPSGESSSARRRSRSWTLAGREPPAAGG
jgi:hypothetical protein